MVPEPTELIKLGRWHTKTIGSYAPNQPSYVQKTLKEQNPMSMWTQPIKDGKCVYWAGYGGIMKHLKLLAMVHYRSTRILANSKVQMILLRLYTQKIKSGRLALGMKGHKCVWVPVHYYHTYRKDLANLIANHPLNRWIERPLFPSRIGTWVEGICTSTRRLFFW